MAIDSRRFTAEGLRLTAFGLATANDARAWNGWRQETDLLGNHQRTRINLAVCNLDGINLSEYNLTNVSFYRTDLRGASLISCDCAHTDFNQAKMIGADLSHANLSRARLSRAYLRGAKLDYADLRRADLRRASLTSASLTGARVEGVDLSSTRGLTQEQLGDARGDSRTRLPSHLEHPDTWSAYETDRDDLQEQEEIDDLRIIPSSVEVAVVGDRLQLFSDRPGDAYFSATSNPDILKEEIISDISLLVERCDNSPLLKRALMLYSQELAKVDYDIILVGVRGVRVQSTFEGMVSTSSPEGVELMPEMVGAIRAVLVQHFLFVSQSHRWKQFLEEAALAPYRDADKTTARSVSDEVVGVLENNPTSCDPTVPGAVDAVTRELEVNDDAQRLATFNVIASVENTFRGVITWIVREAKRFLGTAWTTFSDHLAKIVGTSMAALTTALFGTKAASLLAHTYPERFGWLLHAIELVKPTH